MGVPFFRPSIGEAEINEVVDTLKGGWVTTGPKCKRFEEDFADFVGAKHAIALNSCTAALHLAAEALGITEGDLVLVPTLTFTATAEVIRYLNATPVLVDSDAHSFCIDPQKTEETIQAIQQGKNLFGKPIQHKGRIKALIPMHYGGQMADMDAFRALAKKYDLALIEDAAHSLPAATRSNQEASWQQAGTLSDVGCFSFYANKTMTTGEGGMAVTNRDDLAKRMRTMSLHGISKDAWNRFKRSGSWYYEVVAPGFKYNMTDIAAALGIQQLKRATEFRDDRERVASRYLSLLADETRIELPHILDNRQHAWHLFVIRLKLDRLTIDRNAFTEEFKKREIGCSVHYIPLHQHPYYKETYNYDPARFPNVEALAPEIITLPLFPYMRDEEIREVTEAIKEICYEHKKES